MKAFLPSKFLQVALHDRGGKPARLDDLHRLLVELDYTPEFRIELLDISEPGLLLLPTRQKRFPFQQDEIDFVKDYVKQGNPIFHLSNHPPLTYEDSRLGRLLGYEFKHCVHADNPENNFNVYPINTSRLPFTSIDTSLHFSVCNSSTVRPLSDSFTVIANFSRSGVANTTPQSAFGIARERSEQSGAIVALGDSGILGEPRPRNPGPGLNAGDNRELICQILKWLKEETV